MLDVFKSFIKFQNHPQTNRFFFITCNLQIRFGNTHKSSECVAMLPNLDKPMASTLYLHVKYPYSFKLLIEKCSSLKTC